MNNNAMELTRIFEAIDLLDKPPLEPMDIVHEITPERGAQIRSAAAHLGQLAVLSETGLPPVVLSPKGWEREIMSVQMTAMYTFWTELVHAASISEEVCEHGRAMLRVIAEDSFNLNGGVAHMEIEAEIYRYCGLEPKEAKKEVAM